LLLLKNHLQSILDLSSEATLAYAEAISALTKAYDKLFNCSFPYSAGIHQAPTNVKATHIGIGT
jgi:UDPglucose--hexose-1-phosphate uridylyltransferase